MLLYAKLIRSTLGPPVVTLSAILFNSNAGNKASGVNPNPGDLVVVAVCVTGNTTTSVADDAGGTYTLAVGAFKATSNDICRFYIRDQLWPGPGGFTVTATFGTNTGGGIAIYTVSGMTSAGSAALRSIAQQGNQAASGTPAPVLSNTPLLKNPIIGMCFMGATVSVQPRAGYTEDFDTTYSTPATGWQMMHRDSGETSATITWGSSPGTGIWGACAIELNAP